MSPKIIESKTTKLFSARSPSPQEGYSSDLRRDLYGKLWVASSEKTVVEYLFLEM